MAVIQLLINPHVASYVGAGTGMQMLYTLLSLHLLHEICILRL